jgi:hypothetical protein
MTYTQALAHLLRVVAKAARIAPPKKRPQTKSKNRKRRTYLPPRAVEPIEEPVFAPSVTPPDVVRGEPLPPPPPIPAPLDAAVLAAASVAGERAARAAEVEAQRAAIDATARWQKQCTAIDAHTGLRCGLVGQHVEHRTARGPFTAVAAPGQMHFARRAALELAAYSDGGAVESLTHRGTELGKRRRGLAHAGDITADDRSVEHNRKSHGEAA